MSYVTEDFTESLNRVDLPKDSIEKVLAAWGHGDGQGTDAGHYRWTDDYGVSDWSGGFLMLLKDGCFAYLTGWCDFTGWGCQDGATVYYHSAQPDLATVHPNEDEHWYSTGRPPAPEEWDIEPADLNRWLKAEDTE